jgi:hypothetical protein
MFCGVCCDQYNKSTKSEIACCFDDCKYSACKECVRTYLINTTNEPHCMKCRKKWDLEFLKSKLNASFMQTEYREHRKNILLDSAISKMSEHYANAIIYNNQKKAEAEIRVKMQKIDELHKEVSKIYKEIGEIRNNPALVLKKGVEERRKFVMPCQSEGCRGMLSSSYKCELCEKFTCPQCFGAIDGEKDDHRCVQEDIDTAEELRRNTKPCPQCGTRISKIDGCDQMWCVECKTAFSWARGTIESGNIHNPHFFQWMRQNGGQIGGACGRENNRDAINSIKEVANILDRTSCIFTNYIYNYEINPKMAKSQDDEAETVYLALKTGFESKFFDETIAAMETYFYNYYRFINHLENVDLRDIRRGIQIRDDDNMLFYKYILNECEKEDLGEFLIRRDVSNIKDAALRDILDAFVVAGRQIIEEFNKELSTVLTYSYKTEIQEFWSSMSGGVSMVRRNTRQIAIPASRMFLFVHDIVRIYNSHIEFINEAKTKTQAILAKYYKIIDNYTNYTNYELMRYFILYNIRRQLTVWNHKYGEEELLRFDTKSDIVNKMKEYAKGMREEPDENSWV